MRTVLKLEMVLTLTLIEIMIFFDLGPKRIVRTLKKLPVLLFGFSDEDIMRTISGILYKTVFGMNIFCGNCVRYTYLGYAYLKHRHPDIYIVLGVKRLKGRISGHMWLEKCSHIMFEPDNTAERYEKLGEFR